MVKNHSFKKKRLLILSWHQTYLKNNAGGYVRLSQFLKQIPSFINYLILDNSPSIYKKTVNNKSSLVEYKTPNFLNFFLKKAFVFWYFFETLATTFILYANAKRIIKTEGIKVIYVPIGEFDHLYLPAILLKKQFPNIKLIVDILNYEMPEKNSFVFYRKLRKNGQSLFRASAIVINFIVNRLIRKNTLCLIDYIFTVSPDLVEKIKKDYKKSSIDFTPSGVNLPDPIVKKNNNQFLAVYVGRMNVEKGINEIIRCWVKVVDKLPKAKVALVGVIDNKFLDYIRQEVKQLNLENNIIIIGEVSEEQKNDILSQSQIFLHLAKYEPLFPVIGILEGLAFGCPVIFYNMNVVSSQINLINKWPCLKVVENGKYEKAAERILEFVNYPTTVKKLLSDKAVKFAKQYEWKKIAQKEFAVIKKLLN